ncbi:MAG: HAMP domain-containing protein [Bacteroidetes bacterium]|nr:HAMP domain-containing protein [Bacteroidota bacterium]MCW5896006.1 HAMP domain-containing protein [Bacteroidota bacterium]
MQITHTIAFRLFLIIVSAQTIVLGVLTYAAVSIQHSQLMEHVELSAQRVSDIIARSTRHSMLLNRKEDVQHIVSAVGGEPGIEGIRIYNKAGEVIFATTLPDIHTVVDLNAEACVSCHPNQQLQTPHPPQEKLSRLFTNPNGQRVLGFITPISNERQCSDADCHAHPANKTILGVLDVKMSLTQVDQRLEANKKNFLLLSLGAALIVALASGGFIWLVIKRPVQKLVTGMQMVSSGNLEHRLAPRSQDEFGLLATTFNKMSEDLERASDELTSWSNTLELKVKEKTADLEKAHRQLMRVEKLASLGNLSSSVAHELNNPLEGILTFSKLLIKRIRKSALSEDEKKNYCDELQLMADEAQRCGNIVKNLLVFARQSSVSIQTAHLSHVIERCVLLMSHHAKMRGVSLSKDEMRGDDTVECDANQLQQAVLALIGNAVEAITSAHPDENSEGKVEISLDGRHPDQVLIRVRDNGIGMSDEVKAHIFEPFFTTKSEGKGVGLGLSILYGIIQRHHGNVEVESETGKGTIFTLILPRKQPTKNREERTTPIEGVGHG